MSEETKKKDSELEEKDLEQVAGGTDGASQQDSFLKIKLGIVDEKGIA
jgi:hypothetical protein